MPSDPPQNLHLTASSSTRITASWQLPPADSRNGIITGFRLFYKRKDSAEVSTTITITNQGSLTKAVTGLQKYTEYEFQVLAFTSVGDGPNSSVIVKRTKEDGKIIIVFLTFLFGGQALAFLLTKTFLLTKGKYELDILLSTLCLVHV